MKIISLELHNYGYWEDLEVRFTEQEESANASSKVILCGEQESGKSTIARSLRWLMYGDLQRPPESTYPFTWNKEQKEQQFVRAIFQHEEEGQIIVTRSRKPGSNKTDRKLIVKGDEKPDSAVPMMWERFFGKSPTTEEEVENLLRVQQMVDIAKKTADPERYQSRLLSFVNIEDIIQRMDSVVQDLHSDLIKAQGASNAPQAVEELKRLTGLIADLNNQIKENEGKIEDYDAVLSDWSDNESKVNGIINKSEEHKKIDDNYMESVIQVANNRAKFQQELRGIFCSSLYGMLLLAGRTDALPDKDSTSAEHLRLRAVIDEFESHISTESKEKLEDLIDPSNELKCIRLLEAPDVISEMKIICTDFQTALENREKAESEKLAKEAESKISPTESQTAELTRQQAIDAAVEKERLIQDNLNKSDQIDIYQEQQEEQTKIIQAASDEGDNAALLVEELNVARAIASSTRSARKDYVQGQFEKSVEVIKDFWDEIDAGHSKASIEYDTDERAIRLKDDTSGEWIDLQYGDGEGDASSGQFEKSLLCMAMARIKIIGMDLPVFMDDAMGDIDPNHKKRAIESAAKHFGQVIYLTNTPESVEKLAKFELKIECINRKTSDKTVVYEVMNDE